MELEMLDYRFRTVIKNGEKKDYAIKVDARKFAIKNSIFKRNRLYELDLEQIKIQFGEDLMMEFWEVLMYMLPEEKVREAIREYAERVSF
jgi:hypothetical protein